MIKKYNIVMVVMDTVRSSTFERLMKSKSLKLSKLGDYVYIRDCIAPSSWTLPSHASLFTGMYPTEHGAHETKEVKSLDIARIKLRHKTIVGDLRKLGYTTYGISANPYIHPIYGFDEFNHFEEESYFTDVHGSVVEISKDLKPAVARYRNTALTDADSTLSKVVKLVGAIGKEDPALLLNVVASGIVLTPQAALKKFRAKYIEGWPVEKGGSSIVRKIRAMELKKPFFFFVNLMEAHDPYIGKKGQDFNWSTPFMKKKVDPALVEKWKRTYDFGVKRASDYCYQIVEKLVSEAGEDTIVVITSDHGQEFGEEGFIGHGTVLHDEVVKVPMIIMLPKEVSKKGVRGPVSLVNVRRFLLSAIRGDKEPLSKLHSDVVYSESFGIPSNVSSANGIDIKKLRSYEKYTKRSFR
ncbi:MAG: sulfatase-like hydrolase/transferase [Candidatus Micrarchaeota archaeon]|nr:sulfatase-like hydrolase/transferase [Candidatus Micrarchaeota archaeon]